MTLLDGITVRVAGPDDEAAVIAVLDAARARSVAAGYDLWPTGITRRVLEPALSTGRTWLAIDPSGTAVATITIDRKDPLWDPDAVAGYVHRLATCESGTGLGGRLLEWADGHVASFGGDRLRLDCIAWDAPLRAYYERAGFVHAGDVPLPRLPGVPLPDRGPVALARYQRFTASP